jgi:Arc/MetJ-type ribon-helix-helix transcriptional regulator
MDKVTITLPSETLGEIDAKVDKGDGTGEYDSRSEAIRELTAEAIRLNERVDSLETENDRLRRELRAANARQEDVGELVEYVEREKSMQERREERRDAPIWRRAKWWLFGRNSEGEV